MNIAYGYKRHEADLLARGAEKVYIDTDRERPRRADMLISGGLRKDDTLIVMSERDLGGSPVADAKIKAILVKRGVTLRVMPPEAVAKGDNGRPSTLKKTANAVLIELYDVWHNPYLTELGRVRECSRIAGEPVTKGQMIYRFGTQANPKPRPQKER